jgi:hypothetical protein
MTRFFLVALAVLPLAGCDDSGSAGWEAGCYEGDDDGYKDGYANGFSCAENQYEQYDEYAAAIGDRPRPDCDSDGCAYYDGWLEGYAECYSGAYSEGVSDGAGDGDCN